MQQGQPDDEEEELGASWKAKPVSGLGIWTEYGLRGTGWQGYLEGAGEEGSSPEQN